ncbi:hypothetical protein BCEP4_880008 [Burkholderia cepacia]|nr:hypothetical protein BCEP4_880008 [Burkholderia cepacia]
MLRERWGARSSRSLASGFRFIWVAGLLRWAIFDDWIAPDFARRQVFEGGGRSDSNRRAIGSGLRKAWFGARTIRRI